MRLKMRSEIAAISESPITVLTAEGFLSSMSPDVSLKKPRSGESLTTEMTLAGQGMRPNMHLQGSKTDVHLLAIFAGKGLFGLSFCRSTMELLMLGEA